jgi:PAS domain S-box-containing protein
MDPRPVLLPVPLVLAAALGAAQLVSRRSTLAFRRLGTLARGLAPRLASGQPPERWPESSLQETSEVMDQFRAATDHLARQFRQVRQSGEQFEQKVAERTLELQKSERKFRMMMENAYDWEQWDAPGGDILYSSPSCERITGLPAECFERDPGALDRLIHPGDYPRWKAHYAAVHRPPEAGGPVPGPSCETDLRILRPDGAERWVEHTCHPFFDSHGTYQGRRVKVRDITDWKLAEQAREHSAALERFSKTQKAIIECNQAIIRAKDEDDLLREFCRISMKVHGVHQVWVGLIGPGGIESMWLAAAIGFQPGSWSRAWARPRLAREDDPFGQTAAEVAIRTRQPCIQGNPAPGQGPDNPARGQGQGKADGQGPGASTRSTIALPLLSGQKVLGALVLNSVNPDNFAEEPGQMLLELANNLAIGIVDLWTRAERDRALLTAERQAEQLRFLAMELTQAEQRERKRLGQLLHDHLQQLLVGATFSVETVNGQVETRVARKTLEKLTETLQEAIQVSRRLAVELSPPVVREKRLGACLEWLRLEFARNHGLKVALDLAGKVDPDPEPVRMFVFEAVRELLLNVVKHAKVDHALLKLRVLDGQRLEITVADHGAGFDPETLEAGAFPADGLGLFSLRQRLRFLKGSLEIKSSPGGGSSFTMVVPAQGWPEERKGYR